MSTGNETPVVSCRPRLTYQFCVEEMTPQSCLVDSVMSSRQLSRLEMTPQLCLVDLGYNASVESIGNDASVMSSELRLQRLT